MYVVQSGSASGELEGVEVPEAMQKTPAAEPPASTSLTILRPLLPSSLSPGPGNELEPISGGVT